MQEKVSQAHARHRIRVCHGKLIHTQIKHSTMKTEKMHSNKLAIAKRWRVSAAAT